MLEMGSFIEPAIPLLNSVRESWHTLKALLTDNGLESLYRAIYFVLDPRIYLFCFLPVFILQVLFPLKVKPSAVNVAFDWSYRVFNILFASTIISLTIYQIHAFYLTILPNLSGNLLNGSSFALQFLVIFLVQDFLRYLSHFVRHKVKWFWYFHSIHHSQRELSLTSTFRSHPVESLTGTLITAIPIGLIGVDPLPWILSGLTSQFWDCFVHAPARINLGFLGRLIVSPQFHRVHHSKLKEHYDKNFGERLVIWDYMFRTAHKENTVYPDTGIPEEIPNIDEASSFSDIPRVWLLQMLFPFRKIYSDINTHVAILIKNMTKLDN